MFFFYSIEYICLAYNLGMNIRIYLTHFKVDECILEYFQPSLFQHMNIQIFLEWNIHIQDHIIEEEDIEDITEIHFHNM